jgi:tetratricopeptide (TPR) repeat protein
VVVPDDLPAPRRSSSLRLEGSVFVGRRDELAELGERVASSRLVTVFGEAGVGKTRLALRFAATQRLGFEGTWFCDLRDAQDVETMCAAVARALYIADEGTVVGENAVTAIGRALAARGRALVVLDNLEHLLPHGAHVALAWLEAAPQTHVIVTSRAPLGVRGEGCFELGPLPVGDGVADGAALNLFVERVRAVRRDFAPEGDLAAAIDEVVRAVRGVPLAVEICASRFASPRARVFALRGHTDTDPVAWAFSRLETAEREALAQCSVFRGGFTLEAAERIVDARGAILAGDTLRPPGPVPSTAETPEAARGSEVRTVLATLVKTGLIQSAGKKRLMLCEGIRATARGHLTESAAGAAAPWRHAQFYLDLASGPLLDLPRTARSAPSRAELEPERENLEAVLEFGAAQGRRDIVLRAAIALDFLSSGTGISRARLALLHDALVDAGDLDPALVGRALGVRAAALRALGRLEEAERDARGALALARRAGSARQIVAMHLAVGGDRFQVGDLDQALAYTRAACQVARVGGHRSEEALALQQTGAVLQAMGDAAGARAHYEASRDLAREASDEVVEVRAAMGLGSYHLEAGDLERAEAWYEQALLVARRRGMARNVRILMGYLGVLHFDAGRLQEAERWLDNAAKSSRAAGDLRVEGIFDGIRGAVLATLDLGDEARARFLSAKRLLGTNAYFRGVVELYEGHLMLCEAREAIGDGSYERGAALVRMATQRMADAEALTKRSDDARIGVRILRRALTG